MCSLLESRYGIDINKQSLDERFNDRCVSFVKSVLCEVLESKLPNVYSPELFTGFHEVRIKDSTKFNVPETLLSDYRGSGGNSGTSKAGISIQYEYDLKSGRIVDLTLTPAVRNDQKDALETVGNVSASDLVIRDMGYFSTAVLAAISQKGAFFLSRLPASVSVYSVQKEQLSFNKLYRQMRQRGINEMELPVFVGENRQIPLRLVVRMVPDEIYEQRLREKEKANRRKGKGAVSDETRIRLRFNLFITNARENDLPLSNVFSLYRVRWQIELMFKVWKSVFKIDRMQRMKQARYISLLYAKLLLIVINLQITFHLQASFSRQMTAGKLPVLSLNKSLKTLCSLFDKLFEILRSSHRKAMAAVREIRERLSKNHWLEEKKNKLSFPEIIQLFICKSEK
jgi:hypothetical protein